MSELMLAPEAPPARPAAPTGGIDRLLAALAAHRRGEIATAERGYREVLAREPAHSAALRLLGMLLLATGRAGEAIGTLRASIAANPDDPDAQTALADAEAASGATTQAIATYRAVLSRWTGQVAARVNLANALLADGAPMQAVAECRLALVSAPRLVAAHITMGAGLLAAGRVVEAIGAYRTAVGIDASSGRALCGYANALLHDRRAVDALEAAIRACALGEEAEPWFLRGAAERALRQYPAARQSLERAVALATEHAAAWLALGNTLADLDDLTGAEAAISRAVSAAPEMAEAAASLGFVREAQGRLAEAIAASDQAIALRPDFARAYWNRGHARLLAGDLAGGFADYEWRRRDPLFADDFRPPATPEWRGESLSGRHLLVIAEQGLGDTIQFARFLPALVARGARVTLCCAASLVPLLAGIPGIAVVAQDAPMPAHDLFAFQMSLPLLLGITGAALAGGAYLAADPARVPQVVARPGLRRVGIAWAGNPAHRNDRRRSLPTEALAPLAGLGGIDWVNLQVDARGTELALMHRMPPPPRRIADFADTAGVMATLDLVISADTAVAHLAGALGRPVWVMLPHAPDWRWMLGRADSPWYASARLFRQERPGDWAGVIGQVVAALGAG